MRGRVHAFPIQLPSISIHDSYWLYRRESKDMFSTYTFPTSCFDLKQKHQIKSWSNTFWIPHEPLSSIPANPCYPVPLQPHQGTTVDKNKREKSSCRHPNRSTCDLSPPKSLDLTISILSLRLLNPFAEPQSARLPSRRNMNFFTCQ